MQIDRDSHLPLYFQLKELLLGSIKNGVWKPGHQLPTEEEIQREYELSRTTVRQALRELELEGRIHRQPGRGTFVTQPKAQEGTESFTLDMMRLEEFGMELKWRVLSAEQVPATTEVASNLKIQPGTNIFELRRLRIANDLVIGYMISCLAGEFLKDVDTSLLGVGGSMNYISRLDLAKCTVERVLEALPGKRNETNFLEMPHGDPVLVLTRLLRNMDGKPIEYYRAYYRGDRFRYHIQSMPPQV